MHLITSGAEVALAFVVGVVGNIVAHDICAAIPSLCEKIVRRAAARVGPLGGDRYLNEWLSHLSDREQLLAKLEHSVGCYLCAAKMRTQAARFQMQVTYRVADVGNVSTELRIPGLVSRLMLFVFVHKIRLISFPTVWCVFFYFRLKTLLGARHNLSPAAYLCFQQNFRQIVHSDFDLVIQWQGVTFDITALIAEYRRDRQATLAKWMEAIARGDLKQRLLSTKEAAASTEH